MVINSKNKNTTSPDGLNSRMEVVEDMADEDEDKQ